MTILVVNGQTDQANVKRSFYNTATGINRSGFHRFDSVAYLLWDVFSTPRAAGGVNGIAAEPGPGVRTVTDTENKLSIANGVLTFAGGKATPGWGDPGLWSPAITRVAGRTLLGLIYHTAISTGVMIGWDTNQAGTLGAHGIYPGSGLLLVFNNSSSLVVGAYSNTTNYKVAIPVRTTGAYYLIQGGAFTNWCMLWIGASNNATTLYPGIALLNDTVVVDDLRVSSILWLPPPLAYDTFTRADGALGTSEYTGPDGQATPVRTWTSRIGTVQVASNKAVATVLSGGIALATVNTGTLDVLHSAALVKTTTSVGVVVRYAGTTSYIYAIHNGTNAQLHKVTTAGGDVTLIDAAATYSANAELRIIVYGTSCDLFYNNAKIGTTQTINDAELQTGMEQGTFYGDTDSTADNVTTFARGTNGEYAVLDTF